MWEFLGKVFEEAGYTATLYLITLGGCGFALWLLWKKINDLHAEIRRMAEEHSKQVKTMGEDHAKRVENIQEKRITEAQSVREALLENQQTLLEAVSKVDQTWRGYLAGRGTR